MIHDENISLFSHPDIPELEHGILLCLGNTGGNVFEAVLMEYLFLAAGNIHCHGEPGVQPGFPKVQEG